MGEEAGPLYYLVTLEHMMNHMVLHTARRMLDLQ